MLNLNNLSSPKGSNKKIKRIGRGQGSGWGTQAGKGHKGQKARSGGGVRTGFEGGSMPLYMRLPKRGFTNAPFRNDYASVSLKNIVHAFEEGEVVNKDSMVSRGLIKGAKKLLPVKVLFSDGLEAKRLTFSGIDKFSKNSLNWIEKSNSEIN